MIDFEIEMVGAANLYTHLLSKHQASQSIKRK